MTNVRNPPTPTPRDLLRAILHGERRWHPMELIAITCEHREDADVYGWERA